MKGILLLLLSVLMIMSVDGQQFERCYTDQVLEEIRINHPAEYKSIVEARKVILEQASLHGSSSRKEALYQIPVVFHVLHAGEAIGTGSNLDSMQIASQIEVLNQDFNRQNTDSNNTPGLWKPIAGSMDIEFILANIDPDGNKTNGITRHNYGQLPNTSTIDNTVKPATTWDAALYFNIWIIDMDNGILGYATLPGTNKNRDGVVLDYRHVGSSAFNNFPGAAPYNRGRTATHEVGHYLGLLHTFQNGCAGTNANSCQFQGDDICDTPPTDGPNYGCNTGTNQNSCTETPNDQPDMPMNYMDYANDACMNLFTNGQTTVMESTLNSSRNSLLNSPALQEQFAFSGQVIDQQSGLGVEDAKVIFIASDYEIELKTGAGGFFTTNAFVEGDYNVYAGKWGYMTKEHSLNKHIDDQTADIIVSIQKGVYYDDFIMNFGWTVTGNAVSGVWERDVPNEATFNGQKTQPDFDVTSDFGYKCFVTGNSGGAAGNDDVDDGITTIYSPVFDASNMNEPVISYERWFFNDGGNGAPLDDEMVIRLSNGSTSVDLEVIDANELNTNQWKQKTYNIKDLLTPTNIMKLYVDISDYAIAGHIVDGGFDAFKVEDSNPTGFGNIKLNSLQIYPNPTDQSFTVDLTSIAGTVQLEVYSLSGRLVYSENVVSNGYEQVDVSTLPAGAYMVRVNSDNTVLQERLLIF